MNPRVSLAEISRRFSGKSTISEDSLANHRAAHLPRASRQAAAQAYAVSEGMRAVGLADQAAMLRDRALLLLDEAERAGDLHASARLVREVRETVLAIGKLTGEVSDPSVTINVGVFADPAWVSLQATLLAVLTPYAEARAAVVDALERLAA